MADGLSNFKVYCIDQDRYGIIWIGTENGLNVYDGINFRHYLRNPNQDIDFPSNSIRDIVLYGDTAYIGALGALFRMDVKTKRYEIIRNGEIKEIRTLLLDKNQEILWIGTNSGLIKYSCRDDKLLQYNSENSNISHNVVRALYIGNDSTLWVGTFNGLNKLLPNSSLFELVDVNTEINGTNDNQLILSIEPLSSMNDSLLLIGSQRNGLVILNQKTNQTINYNQTYSQLVNNVVKAINVASSGIIWLGTDFGLIEIDKQFASEVHLHNPYFEYSLSNNVVWDIFEDNSGAIWCGTNNGISILSSKRKGFQYFPITISKQGNIAGCEVRGISNFSSEQLLLSTQNGLIIHYQNTEVHSEIYESPNELLNDVNNSLIDKTERIWIATKGGISLIEPDGTRKDYFAYQDGRNGLRTNYINNIFELDDGTLLLNTYKGVHKILQNDKDITFEFVGDFYINAIADGIIWAWNQSTLLRIDEKTFHQTHEITFNLDHDFQIHSLLFSETGKIWVGINNGLIEYDEKTGEYVYHEIQLSNEYPLINLLEDNEGNIWASSYSSILKFSLTKEEFEIYSNRSEIPVDRFIENANHKTASGDLIFGGHDGYIKIEPENISESNYIPPIKITGLNISNEEIIPGKEVNGKIVLKEEIAFTDKLVLDYRNNSFSIEFSSLLFGNRDGLRYAYRLEGKDESWNLIDNNQGRASYSKVAAGNYTFRVKGSNSDGVIIGDETTLSIAIRPPLWASHGFISGYILLIIILIVIIVQYFIKDSRIKTNMKLLGLEKEYAKNLAIKRQQFITNISHEFRTPLNLIIGPLEKLNKNLVLDDKNRNYLTLILNNTKRLLWLNNQLLDFRKIENQDFKLEVSSFDFIQFSRNVYTLFHDLADSRNIEYQFKSEVEELSVSMDIRKVETILHNLLSNAFKFTPENGKIKLTVKSLFYQNNLGILMEIEDSGIGIPEKDQLKIFERFYQSDNVEKLNMGTGIGLTLVNEYVKIHGGNIEVKSVLEKGTTFRIILPVKQESEYKQNETQASEVSLPVKEHYKAVNSAKQDIDSLQKGEYILLVEDDNQFADFLFMSLREKYDVYYVSNAKDALITAFNKVPALVISDVTMTEMSGFELTKRIKSNPKTSHIPVILISGQDHNESQVEGFQSGADAYLIKPFSVEMLELRISNFLEHAFKVAANLETTKLIKPSEKKISTQDEKILMKVVMAVEKHMSDSDLDVKKLCAETGFDYHYLYRKIKNISGKSINELIRNVRIQRAAQILSTQKVTVAEVMHETGFTSHSYFSKCFRKVYNISPKEYMKK